MQHPNLFGTKYLFFAVSLFLTCPLFASVDQKDSVDTVVLDKALVMANHKQKMLLEHPQMEPVSLQTTTSEIKRIDIQKQGAISLVDALKYTPGAWVESRGRKVKQMFSVRGQSYPYPSYTINGIWQNQFQEMAYFVNSANIESVTINRSSSALLSSLSALTGVINVKTIEPTSRELRFFGKYGSLNTYQTGLSYSDATDRISYTAAVNGNGSTGPKGRNGEEHMLNAMGSFKWQITDKFQWGMNVFGMYGKRQLVMPVAPADSKFLKRKEEYSPYQAMIVATNLKYKATDSYTSDLQLNFAGRKPVYKSTDLKTNKVSQYNEADYELTANWINAVALHPNNTLRAGLLYNYWQAPKGKRYYYGKKAEVQTISGVVTDQHSFGRISVDAGFRLTGQYYNSWGGFNIEGSAKPFSKVAPIKNEWQSPEWQAIAGLSYAMTDRSTMNFSYAGGVVTPRKGALTNDGHRPNNEVRMNFDLGYTFAFGEGNKLSLTGFLVNRNHAIAFSGKTIEDENGNIMELYKNVDKRNFGFEGSFQSAKFFNAFSFFTNATYMLGQEQGEEKWAKDDEVPSIIANLGVQFDMAGFDANAYLNYVGPYKNDRFVSKDYLKEFGKALLGNFVTFDMNVGYRFARFPIRLFVEGHNLIGTPYQTCAGYPDYGRIIMGGIDLKF